jgi:hypothetical protein
MSAGIDPVRATMCAVLFLASAQGQASDKPQAPVRVIIDGATRKACAYLGLVTVRKAMGFDKAGGALKKALDKTAQMGGNGLFLINQSETWTEGASVSGEALKCPAEALP